MLSGKYTDQTIMHTITQTCDNGLMTSLNSQHGKPRLETSVGTVLIFQFIPGFGTEDSVPTVQRYHGSGSYFSIPELRSGFSGVICIFFILVRFHFGFKSGGT